MHATSIFCSFVVCQIQLASIGNARLSSWFRQRATAASIIESAAYPECQDNTTVYPKPHTHAGGEPHCSLDLVSHPARPSLLVADVFETHACAKEKGRIPQPNQSPQCNAHTGMGTAFDPDNSADHVENQRSCARCIATCIELKSLRSTHRTPSIKS